MTIIGDIMGLLVLLTLLGAPVAFIVIFALGSRGKGMGLRRERANLVEFCAANGYAYLPFRKANGWGSMVRDISFGREDNGRAFCTYSELQGINSPIHYRHTAIYLGGTVPNGSTGDGGRTSRQKVAHCSEAFAALFDMLMTPENEAAYLALDGKRCLTVTNGWLMLSSRESGQYNQVMVERIVQERRLLNAMADALTPEARERWAVTDAADQDVWALVSLLVPWVAECYAD